MLVLGPSKSVVLKVKDPLFIRGLLPKHSRVVDAPEGNIIVRHTLETTCVLKNLGLKVPSPIGEQYSWPGKYPPFSHQRVMADFLTTNAKNFNFSDMGVGKSAATLWAADYLMKLGIVHRALVIAPLSTLEQVWKQSIFDILMHRSCVVTHGERTFRTEAFSRDVDFYIVNHDGITHRDIARLIRARDDIDLIIVDEVSFFRNPKTLKARFLRWAIEKKTRIWLVTGTPVANGPTDAWSITRLIDPSRVPKHFGTFKRQTMIQVSDHRWVPRRGAENIAFAAMQPAIRFRKSECLDLPLVTYMNREVSLTPDQYNAFIAMRDSMRVQFKTGSISAVNAGDQINKLRQIFLGAMRDPETGQYIILDHKFRLKVLKDTINEAQTKVIVIVPFKGIIRALEKELENIYSLAVLNGDVTITQRNRIIFNFKNTEHPHLLLCHEKVMSHGLNLVEADTTIFYGPIYSHDMYAQVIERFNRPGQRYNMRVVRLGAHPLEWDIYGVVDNKAKMQDSVLRLYEKVIQ